MGKNKQMNSDDLKLHDRPPVTVGNMQKLGSVFLYGNHRKVNGRDIIGNRVEIKAGEDAEVPAAIWDRYKDRQDVKALLGTKLIVGGVGNASVDSFGHRSDVDDYMASQMRRLKEEKDKVKEYVDLRLSELQAGAN